jgi:hypothetical protein
MNYGCPWNWLLLFPVYKEPNFPGHMLTLSDMVIFKPSEKIKWHRKRVFKT